MATEAVSTLEADTRAGLRRVGTVLLVVGLLDIGLMIYAIAAGQSYSSSFNIFAVVAGILLRRGSVGTARIVRVFACFMLTGFALVPLLMAAIMPFGLERTYLRITPLADLLLVGCLALALLALLWWVYRSLSAPGVDAAIRALPPGFILTRWANSPRAGFAAGILLAAAVGLGTSWMLQGEMGREAAKRACAARGPDTRCFVSALASASTRHGTHVLATVMAYTDASIETVTVEWQE